MSEPSTPNWLNWVLPVLALLGVLWAIVKRLFVQAVRSEMTVMHQENQHSLHEISSRLGEVENTVSNIQGRIQERWGDSQQD